ncbi:MAG TPA: hypothetical protein VF425_09610 [Thermoanaerobaculia bacterium]
MIETTASAQHPRPPSKEELELDLRLELILDECVAESKMPPWESELTARVMAARPFAPWEVRRARAWRVPALAAAGLLAASLAVFLAPLWSLGPQAALEMWARVMAAGTAGGLPALLAAGPALADALAALARAPGTRPTLAGALFASGGIVAFLARRLSRRPTRLLAGAPPG